MVKKILISFTIVIFLMLCSCTYHVETIFDGLEIEELEEVADFHFTAEVDELTMSKVENYSGILLTSFDYYKITIDECFKGDVNGVVYIRYAKNVADVEDLIVGEKYHFYCMKLSQDKVPNKLENETVFNIESPNAQCYIVE